MTIQGTNIQSHYIPAEKPYAVYAFVWNGPSMAIAQLIGTMLVGKADEEGRVKFEGKAVYRMPDKRDMLDFHHCFVSGDTGEIENDPFFLGFAGDIVGKDELVNAVRMELSDTDSQDIEWMVESMKLAGLKVQLGDECKMQDVSGGHFDSEYEYHTKGYNRFVALDDDIALRVKVWDSEGKSTSPRYVLSTLLSQIEQWERVGVTFERIRMSEKEADYQEQVDAMLELTRLYSKYVQKQGRRSQLFHLLACREYIGTGRFLYDDFVMGMKKAWYDDFERYDEDLEWAIGVGLIQREGNIIQFLPDLERMGTWQWHWLHGEENS